MSLWHTLPRLLAACHGQRLAGPVHGVFVLPQVVRNKGLSTRPAAHKKQAGRHAMPEFGHLGATQLTGQLALLAAGLGQVHWATVSSAVVA
jgi:hypothetical protein